MLSFVLKSVISTLSDEGKLNCCFFVVDNAGT